MRILITTDTVGGVWTYAIDLARALEPHGVEIGLATMGRALSTSQRHQVESLRNVHLYESAYKLEWMEEPWDEVRLAGDWLLDIEREFAPEVIHLNGFAHGTREFSAPVLVVGHSCVLSWWRACRGEEAPPSWERYRRAVAAGLAAADFVVAPSHAMMCALQQNYGAIDCRRVIANGRCAAAYSSTGQKERMVLSAGRLWDEGKNVAALESIAPALSWPVYIAGDERHPDGRSAVTHAGTFLGQLEEASLAGWYRRAAIYALPARYEPFGLSILEAALSGCALVLGDIASLHENWAGAAVFVEADDSRELKDAIEGLIAHSRQREDLAQAALKRAGQFSTESMASAYLDVYRELIEGESHRRGVRRAATCAS